jgi:GNAT superfamily N-acetyltransferase
MANRLDRTSPNFQNRTDMKKNPAHSERALARARSRLEILPGRPDPEGLLALARTIFPGEDIVDPRYLPWLYDQNPAGPAYEFMTRDRGLVTGHAAALPLRYKIGAEEMTGSLGVNAITHPAFRGKGIFILLYEEIFKLCVRDGNPFMFGFANSNSHKGCLRHLDFQEIGQLPLWILPFDLRRILASRKSRPGPLWRVGAGAANPFLGLGLSVLRPRPDKDIAIEKIKEFGSEFDGFWETVKNAYPNCLIRNRAFLDWRFVRQPTRRYDIFAARKGGRLLAYLAGTLTTIEGLRWGMIVDMLAADTPEGRAAGRGVVAAFHRHIRSEGADLAAALMLKRAPPAKALRRNGYLVCPRSFLPREFPVLLRWNMPSAPPAGFFDLESWHLTLGDYDAV